MASVIDRAQAQLLHAHPFFATLMLQAPPVESIAVPLMATDGRQLIRNTPACSTQPVPVVISLFAHEILHIIRGHVPTMIRMNLDRTIWNYATDYVNNLLLKDCGLPGWEGWLCDEQYRDMSELQVYYQLLKDPPPSGGGGDGPPGTGMDLQEPADTSEEALLQQQHRVAGQVAQAAMIARAAGKLPGALQRLIDGILAPKAPWPELLREYMQQVTQLDTSWARRNRRFRSMYLPARHSLSLGEIVVIVDTSGSIGDVELQQALTEIETIAQECQPERIRLIWADAEVAGEQTFEVGEPIRTGAQPKGGGGTDMRVPLAYAEAFEPVVCILITDGYTPWPTHEPDYPLIVCCTTATNVPIGRVVRIDE